LVVIAAVALLATLRPARDTSCVDPIALLRCE
jgi:ABC-type lipoprotein release transport system permease subunit